MNPQCQPAAAAVAFAHAVSSRPIGVPAPPSSRAAGGIAALLAAWLFVLCASLGAGSAFAAGFVAVPAPATPRAMHTSTLLPSGKVLVVGGTDSGGAALASTELYDPLTHTWSAGPALAAARAYHTASLLRSGQVLVVGGYDGSAFIGTAQLYDPLTNSWSAAAPPAAARINHTATVLASGKVLLVGGNNAENVLNTAEIYDPASDSWSTAQPLSAARTSHTATLMPSGRVLVAGGFRVGALNSAVLYDPPTDTWITALAMATARSAHSATLLPNGKVLVSGGLNGSAAVASAELFDATTGWSTAAPMGNARQGHAAALLSTGEVLVAGGAIGNAAGSARLGAAETYNATTNRWTHAGDLVAARSHATLTALPDGSLLFAGGADSGGPLASAELFDRVSLYQTTWIPGGTLAAGREDHTSTALPSGKVLVTGGGLPGNGNSALSSAELYDPAANRFSVAASLPVARRYHTATLLASGKVLVAGGYDGSNMLNTAVLYDPATNSWSPAGTLARGRGLHTAVLLASGKVLVAGGTENGGGMPTVAELYDPASNSWSSGGTIATGRFQHVMALLQSGKVMIAGGGNSPNNLFASVEIYDPATNIWSPGASLPSARAEAAGVTLPTGKVLVTGGVNSAGLVQSDAPLYDPASNSWSYAASMSTQRRWHTAAVLASGKVLVAGGVDGYFSYNVHDWAELYDPVLNLWMVAGGFGTHRYDLTLTPLSSGKVLLVGGTDNSSAPAAAMLYEPPTTSLTFNVPAASSGRGAHTVNLLSTGRLLFAGGANEFAVLGSTERFDAATTSWSSGAALATPRKWHTATTLPDGRVLAIGGQGSGGVLASVERYDPADSWSAAAALTTARHSHTATLLADGRLLVAGGFGSDALASVERYDPATNAWTATGALTTPRQRHAATLLPSGKVLVTGGSSASAALNTAELYDPATGTWSSAGTFSQTRELHTATLLPTGKVLLLGGRSGTSYRGSVGLYDPASNTWSVSSYGLITATFSHTATLLPSGRVLIAGGDRGDGGGQRRVAIYDPLADRLLLVAPLSIARYGHSATLLPTGKVLIAGGFNANGAVSGAEIYDPDQAPLATRRPDLLAAGSFATASAALTATVQATSYSGGAVQTTGFLAPFEGSGGGVANSATGLPVLQIQRLDNDQYRFVDGAANSLTDTSFTGRAAALSGFPPGPVLVRAWVNGVPGSARYSTIAATAGQPTAVSASAGTQQATVTFTPPTNYTGGAPITGYVATATGGATATCNAPCSSIVFNPLPGGAYTFTVAAVNAAGAGTPSAASNSVTVKAAPTLDVVSGTNPGHVGDSLTFTATLDQAYLPSGNVQFCANSAITLSGCSGGTVLCTVAASTTPLTCTTAALPAGTHQINAWYPGDANNLFAASPSLNQVIAKRMPSLGWAEPAPITYGTPLGAAQLNATATFDGNPVAGTFTYLPPAGAVLGAGANQLTATFAPSDTATYATPGEILTTSLQVSSVTTTSAIGSLSVARVGMALNVPYTVTSVDGGPAVPGGDFVVVTATPSGASCTASVAAGQCAITFASAGNYSLSAEYQGSMNFLPSVSSPATAVTVSKHTTTTTLGSTPNPSLLGQAVTASVTVASSSGGPLPSGEVSISADSGESCLATLSAGAGQCTLSMTHTGARTLSASYAGDTASAVSTGSVTQTVNRASVAISVDDQHSYARYSAVPSYTVTLSNASLVATHPTLAASTAGTGLSLAGAQWFCTNNGGGSGCTDGTGPFTASLTLPANSSMTWTLLVPVVPASSDPTITLRIDVGGDVNPANASDVNTLVIFRNGLQVPVDTQ